MARDITKPSAPAPRHPLDTKQMHGNIKNPPRIMHMGGANALHVPGGPHKSDLPAIKKPGGTR